MRILGIDPGYGRLGWGLVEMRGNHFAAVAYDCIETQKDLPHTDRLKVIYSELMDIIDQYRPDAYSVEKLYFNTNVTTGIKVAEARGVALLAAANSGIKVFEYTPLQIKSALTGYGQAEKIQVEQQVKRILNLEKAPKLDDTSDALAAAICHGFTGDMEERVLRVRKGI